MRIHVHHILTADRLRQLLSYNSESGIFVWRMQRNRIPVGALAGTESGDGYINISVDNVVYRAHRLAWLFMTGDWPPKGIDHKDTDRSNNKWNNLRLSTQSQNAANARKSKSNKSGFKGVSWCRARGKWQAQIMKDGTTLSLGHFLEKEHAALAYQRAASDIFGSFARAE